MQEKYVHCLKKELKHKLEEVNGRYNITTVYIGGGTPSYIDSKYIKEILQIIKSKNVKLDNAEITIEVNPGTVTKQKLIEYKEAGINRLSIGLQSCNNELLKAIGRIHTYEQFLDTYSMARDVGFNNINVDLMLGLPKQTIQDLKLSLNKLINLNIEHISVYSLILEENTKLYDLVEKKQVTLPDEEQERQMYWFVKNTLELNGYRHYEISNFAKSGYESKHNVNCWKQKEYIGIGLNASSYIDSERYSNIENIKKYIKNIEVERFEENKIIEEQQDEIDKQKEFMILGLRMTEGINVKDFKNKFEENPIYIFNKELNELVNAKLISIDGDIIKLTNRGLDLANQVWIKFI